MDIDRNGFHVLDRAACLARLGTTTLGRIAFLRDGEPTMLPVNFRLVDDEIVIGTGAVGALAEIAPATTVAFEADHFDGLYRAGWSVLVHGAIRAGEARSLEALRSLPFERWSLRPPEIALIIDTTRVTGREMI